MHIDLFLQVNILLNQLDNGRILPVGKHDNEKITESFSSILNDRQTWNFDQPKKNLTLCWLFIRDFDFSRQEKF